MIEDSGVSSVNEAFGVDGNPFGVGQADGVDVLCQTGLRLQLNQGNVRFRYDERTCNSNDLEKEKGNKTFQKTFQKGWKRYRVSHCKVNKVIWLC